MLQLDEIYAKLGLNKTNGLFLTKDESWKTETAFPNRVKRLLDRKLEPDAFFCFDDKPLILFFTEPVNKKELHKAIWNFNECPIAIVIERDNIEILNGFNYLKDHDSLEKLGDLSSLTDFSYFELVTGKVWEQYHEHLNYRNRVDFHLLNNIKAAKKSLTDQHELNSKIANAIIGKVIFVRYLIDRRVKMKYDGKLRAWSNDEFCNLLDNPKEVQNFFQYLDDKEKGFNGDLFPLSNAEYNKITKRHYQVLKRLLKGEQIEKNQLSLFELYDFSIIPIEFISNVYELFIGKENQKKEGAYYTPLFLVDYILKETVEKHLKQIDKIDGRIDEILLPSSNYHYCRVLDPACGSGIFLVETLRKIIEKHIEITGIEIKTEKFKTIIKNLAKENIFGIDKDESAVQVAIFSIYLTLLDYLEPPGIETFKFPMLLNNNFFVSDFFDEDSDFNRALKQHTFNYILGNPPWEGNAIGEKGKGYLSRRKKREKDLTKEYDIAINNGEIVEGFILRASDFTNEDTQVAFIIRSTILYNKGYSEESKFRQYFLDQFHIDRVFELAPVRHEVFDRSNDPAIAPAAIIFYRYANGKKTDKNLIEYFSLKPSRFFSLFKVFTLNRIDFKKVEQKKLKDFDWLWKVLVYGSFLDFNFIKRLYDNFILVSEILADEEKFLKGTGVKFSSNPTESSNHLKSLPFIDAFAIEPFFVNPRKISIFNLENVGRKRNEALFTAPMLLVRNGLDTKLLTAKGSLHYTNAVYKNSLTGIKSINNDVNVLRDIAGLLSSDLYSYLAINTFGSIGIEREQTKEYEKFNIPYLNTGIADIVKKIEGLKMEIFNEAEKGLIDTIKVQTLQQEVSSNIQKINDEINTLTEASKLEERLIDYSLTVTRPLITRVELIKNQAICKYEDITLNSYANIFIDRFKSKLDSKDKKFIVEIVYSEHVIGMFFKMVATKNPSADISWSKEGKGTHSILPLVAKLSSEKITDRLFVQKDIRGFEKEFFYIFKPNERRLWHEAIGYLDVVEFVDAILKSGRDRR